MEDTEGVLSFDFEGGLDTTTTSANPSASVNLISTDSIAVPGGNPAAAGPSAAATEPVAGIHNGRRSFRQTVCRHWLRSLCMKGDACGFLHQYDKSRMPVCRFFRLYGECREQDCVYKHTNEDIKECNMYKLGFCPNGPDCRYRHAKLPGPPPPVEEVFQKIQHLSSFNYGSSNRFFQHRNYTQQTERPPFPQGSNPTNQALAVKQPTTAESPNMQQQQLQVQQPQQQQVNQTQTQNIPDGLPNQGNKAAPLPQGLSRYFIVKSCNRENLELSVQQGVWATQRSNEAKLNEAFDSAENVILIFSVNRTRHFQGCAKMMSKIGGFVGGGNWKYAHGTAHYGRNFSVKWLKLCELSFHKTRHLRNPYNENLPVKISRDCQELEPSIGEQLASLLYLEPDSELMAISVAAESKREEEKAKGVNPDDAAENPDIVPFEDNEDEEEEESEEEDESYNQALAAGIGRGRGRGMMWPPQMQLARGARPVPGVRGFPPVMMGSDGFTYGALTPDGFPVPDMFGVAPRVFAPFGPRFSNDFTGLGQSSAMGFNPMDAGPTSGMVFHGRPSQPGNVFPGGGLGMMMGPGRAPFMGGMGMPAAAPVRTNRPMGMQQFRQPPPPQPSQNSNWVVKRDQRRTGNDRYSAGSDQSKGQEMAGPGGPDEETKYQQGVRPQSDDSFGGGGGGGGGVGGGNSFRNDESESEDEAPRRSRHGEGKKR
ncbi:zinc finger protein [Macleaya cordata]|uniref:Zinc finger protein n=1 Tax=Macleaya cordata TaxID=56857 RepID=A0A200QKL0_MACCD|nr:zinc finger protein [Macleaya cordata]